MDQLLTVIDKMLYENVTIWRDIFGEYQTSTSLGQWAAEIPETSDPCAIFRENLRANNISSTLTQRGSMVCIKFQIPSDKVVSLEVLYGLEGTIKVVGDYCYVTAKKRAVRDGDQSPSPVLAPTTTMMPPPPAPQPVVVAQNPAAARQSSRLSFLWPF
ncbi:ORF36 [black bullhead herpesvirus]|uniref:ORF36 n=1 Tax=black bullhead herpesvirus TaxID=508441 RepID=A0A2H5AJH7_9VIRU|nr:ORF36 [black bullhead herpesvirus]AUG72289.1 ORF36 [black bullhead herpesvirus]